MKAVSLFVVAALAVSGGARAGETIVIGTHDVRPIRGFPHALVDWVSSRFWPLMFDALTEVGENGDVIPALAVSWQARDPHTWAFELRRGVTFSNGEPMDATAVAETIAYLLTPEAAGLLVHRHITNIEGASALGEYTVVIRTKSPDLMLPGRLRTVRILPPRYFKTVGADAFALQPHGTGPFMAKTLAPGRSTFVRNPNAWRAPNADQIDFVQVGDALARAQGVVSGSIDIALNTGPSVADIAAPAGARLVAHEIGSVDAMPFVTVAPGPLQDRRVRLALNYAVNKQPLIDAFAGGATKPATQFAPPATFGFKAGDPAPFPYDPAKARALLAEAGYPNGFDTAMEVWVDSTDSGAIFQQIAADLNAVGVRAKIINVPILEWQNDGLYGGKWKAPIFNFSYNALPSFDALDSLTTHSCLWAVPFTCDKDFSKRISAAGEMFSLPERRAATEALFAALREDPVAILLFPSVRFDLVGPRIKPFRAAFGIFRYDELEKRAN